MNGVNIVLSKNKMQFMAEYHGDPKLDLMSAEKSPQERSFSDELRSFGLRLHHEDQFLTVHVVDAGLKERPDLRLGNIDRIRKAYMDQLSEDALSKSPVTTYAESNPASVRSKKILTTNVGYESHTDKADRFLGLNWTDTHGHGVNYLHGWNWVYYWPPAEKSDEYGDFIRCMKGLSPGNNSEPNQELKRCRQHFYMKGLDARVVVSYKVTQIKNWAVIKEKAVELIESTYVDSASGKDR